MTVIFSCNHDINGVGFALCIKHSISRLNVSGIIIFCPIVIVMFCGISSGKIVPNGTDIIIIGREYSFTSSGETAKNTSIVEIVNSIRYTV